MCVCFSCQPLFKNLSQLWCGLQDEAELLKILNNIKLNLQPFLHSQAQIFSEAYLDGLLDTTEVKTDKQRMSQSPGDVTNKSYYHTLLTEGTKCRLSWCVTDERIDPAEMKPQEWFLPETTASFTELPLQYNGVCGYTLVNTDGLLLPGRYICLL